MTEPISLEQLKNASLDAKTLEEVINGDDNTDVTSRLGATYPTLDKALKMMLENGLLGATPFKTHALLLSSNLNNDSYAVVTDDPSPTKNGIYQKADGEWRLSGYNDTIGKLAQNHLSAIQALASRANTYPISANNLDLAWGVVDKHNHVGIGITHAGDILAADIVITGADNEYAFAITDNESKVAFAITKDGKVMTAKPSVNLYVADGDIYAIQGNVRTRLTATGDNQAPILRDDGVRFVSNRLGEYHEYTVNLDTLDIERYFITNNRYEQIVITGQSLAQGGANAAITTTAPYPDDAFKFANGPVGSNTEVIVPTITALSESVNETIATGFAKKLLSQKRDRTLLMSGQAHGGYDYSKLKKNGTSAVYQQCIEQVKYGSYLGGGNHVRAVLLVHGEADGNQGNQNYHKNLREWLDDYNADIKAATGQVDNIVMLTCQTSSASGYKDANAREGFVTPFLQLKASQNNHDIILVTPKYFMTYKDYAHIDAPSTRLLGEYYAKVYRHAVINGNKWQPLQPQTITRTGNKIVIDFIVPKPPIVFDTTKVIENSSNTHKGFVLKNAGGVAISDVVITSPTQITITASDNIPDGAVLSYAFDNGVKGKAGAAEGARGNVRDSDDGELSAYTNEPLYNWLVIFKHTF